MSSTPRTRTAPGVVWNAGRRNSNRARTSYMRSEVHHNNTGVVESRINETDAQGEPTNQGQPYRSSRIQVQAAARCEVRPTGQRERWAGCQVEAARVASPINNVCSQPTTRKSRNRTPGTKKRHTTARANVFTNGAAFPLVMSPVVKWGMGAVTA